MAISAIVFAADGSPLTWKRPFSHSRSSGETSSIAEATIRARSRTFRSSQLDQSGRPFYESVDIELARHPQTILAYAMNGEPLAIPHGAPLRLRVETELGFKMVKWLRRIEFVADYRDLGDGQGGSREDNMFYEQAVGI